MPRSALRFLIHQLVSTEGVIVACALLASTMWSYTIGPLLSTWNPAWRSVRPSWLLIEIPMFPVQTMTSLLLGFALWRRLQHGLMFWVWVVPCLVLIAAFCGIPESHKAPFAYFFGSGCMPQHHCFTQVALTLPLPTSVAYAAGAALANALAAENKNALTRETRGVS